MLSRLDLIKDYKQFWFVTITLTIKTIEPYVPNKMKLFVASLNYLKNRKSLYWLAL